MGSSDEARERPRGEAARDACEGDAHGLATVPDDAGTSGIFKLSKHRENRFGTGSCALPTFDIAERSCIRVEWLDGLKDALLLSVKSYETLLTAHLILLAVQLAMLLLTG